VNLFRRKPRGGCHEIFVITWSYSLIYDTASLIDPDDDSSGSQESSEEEVSQDSNSSDLEDSTGPDDAGEFGVYMSLRRFDEEPAPAPVWVYNGSTIVSSGQRRPALDLLVTPLGELQIAITREDCDTEGQVWDVHGRVFFAKSLLDAYSNQQAQQKP